MGGFRKDNTMKMKDLPLSERPYEKLKMYGEQKLSNAELLAVIIQCGTKDESSVMVAQKLLALNSFGNKDSLNFIQDLSLEELTTIKGIGWIKAIQLKAICELCKRMARPINLNKVTIKYPEDVANLVMDELRYERKEMVKVVILNSKNIVLKIADIAIGGTNFAAIEPKQALMDCIKMGAPKIILIHNHPSR